MDPKYLYHQAHLRGVNEQRGFTFDDDVDIDVDGAAQCIGAFFYFRTGA